MPGDAARALSAHEERSSYYGRVLGEYDIQCPICEKGVMRVQEVEYEIPSLGPVLLVSKKCNKCGYRRTDMVPLRSGRRVRIYLRVETPEEYRAKIIRSPYACVIIPELGLYLRPGASAEMFVTNVEGILHLFLDAVERYEVLEGVEFDEFKRALENIIHEQSTPLTLIVDDSEGLSVVLPEPGTRPLLVIEVV